MQFKKLTKNLIETLGLQENKKATLSIQHFVDDVIRTLIHSEGGLLKEAETVTQMLAIPIWGTYYTVIDILAEDEGILENFKMLPIEEAKKWLEQNLPEMSIALEHGSLDPMVKDIALDKCSKI